MGHPLTSNSLKPQGNSWLHVGTDQPFKSICIGGGHQVWAIARDSAVFYRGSVSAHNPAGETTESFRWKVWRFQLEMMMDILQYCKYCWFWFSNLSNLHQLINVIQCIKYKTFLHFEKVIKVNYILLKWGEIMQVTSISLLKYLILFLLSLCILVFIKNAYKTKTLLVVLCHYLHV